MKKCVKNEAHNIINETRPTKNQENFARRFVDHYLANQ